jgi:asparagine synthase (glutamine-hydrolysing)
LGDTRDDESKNCFALIQEHITRLIIGSRFPARTQSKRANRVLRQNRKMCGIAGYIAPKQSGIAALGTRKMVDALARRGPDSAGLAEWPGAALGHRRLAIIDLSPAGHQPMLSDDGAIGLVFNGCIYNFLELREELESKGHHFRSRCDTEVLLRGYQEWGIDSMAQRLRGMFALAIWDEPRRKLTLVRDRLGVKPLAYCVRNGEIAFASTVGALRSAGFGGAIDPRSVLEFLEYGYVTDERSIYAGIHKLPPAAILEWQADRIEQRTYWTLPECDESGRVSFGEAVEETERLLVEAVRLRLTSDVPLGALLSGGIDSALICWAMTKLNANVKAFTVGSPGDDSDESADASETARILGIPHEIVTLPKDRPVLLDEMVEAYSEPFGSQSAQGMLMVSRAVKPMATVLLTGDGGDEVYLGYPFLKNAWMAQKLARRLPPAAAGLWNRIRPLAPELGAARRVRNFFDYATGGLARHIRAHDGLPYLERRSMLGERFEGIRLAQRQMEPSAESARRLLFDVFAYHRKMHFLSEFMPKVDGATMHYAVEARSPLLDQKIWEFAATLAPEVRFHGGMLKAVLREIVRRRVSRRVASRKKQGFTVPVDRQLTNRSSREFDCLRSGSRLEEEGWVPRGKLEAAIGEVAGKNSVPPALWHLLVLEHWLRRNRAASESSPAPGEIVRV